MQLFDVTHNAKEGHKNRKAVLPQDLKFCFFSTFYYAVLLFLVLLYFTKFSNFMGKARK